MIGSPGQKPRLHILMPNIMAILDLPFGLAHFRQHGS